MFKNTKHTIWFAYTMYTFAIVVMLATGAYLRTEPGVLRTIYALFAPILFVWMTVDLGYNVRLLKALDNKR